MTEEKFILTFWETYGEFDCKDIYEGEVGIDDVVKTCNELLNLKFYGRVEFRRCFKIGDVSPDIKRSQGTDRTDLPLGDYGSPVFGNKKIIGHNGLFDTRKEINRIGSDMIESVYAENIPGERTLEIKFYTKNEHSSKKGIFKKVADLCQVPQPQK